MTNPFVRKLELLGPLSQEERRSLEAFPLDAYRAGADQRLVRAGERPADCKLLVGGLACRHKLLGDGRRQIVSFHVPGDILDLAALLLGSVDHGVSTVTEAEVVSIPHATLLGWMERHPNLGRLLWHDTLVDAAAFQEWVVNVGRRTARERVAHLLCELAARLRAAGLAGGRSCLLPVTYAELADATGLTAVHVNRVLQDLRADGLVEVSGRALVVLDWKGLTWAGDFDPAYLHQLAAAA